MVGRVVKAVWGRTEVGQKRDGSGTGVGTEVGRKSDGRNTANSLFLHQKQPKGCCFVFLPTPVPFPSHSRPTPVPFPSHFRPTSVPLPSHFRPTSVPLVSLKICTDLLNRPLHPTKMKLHVDFRCLCVAKISVCRAPFHQESGEDKLGMM